MSNDNLVKRRAKNNTENSDTTLSKKREINVEQDEFVALSKKRETTNIQKTQTESVVKKRDDKNSIDYRTYVQTTTKKKNKFPIILIVLALLAFLGYKTLAKDTNVETGDAQEVVNEEVADNNNNEESTLEDEVSNTENTQEENTYNESILEDTDEYTNIVLESNSDSNSYLIEDSNERYISEYELSQYTKEELAYLRNEIYAKKGYVFKLDKYKEHFENKSWYTPNPSISDDYSDLNMYELANVKLIKELESK